MYCIQTRIIHVQQLHIHVLYTYKYYVLYTDMYYTPTSTMYCIQYSTCTPAFLYCDCYKGVFLYSHSTLLLHVCTAQDIILSGTVIRLHIQTSHKLQTLYCTCNTFCQCHTISVLSLRFVYNTSAISLIWKYVTHIQTYTVHILYSYKLIYYEYTILIQTYT